MAVSLLFAFCAMAKAAEPSCPASASDMMFGTVNLSSGNTYSTTSSISINCSGGDASRSVTFCVSIGEGVPASATGSPRRMTNGSNLLSFDIFSDPAMTQVFGSWTWGYAWKGVQVSRTLSAAGSLAFNVTAYGQQTSVQKSASTGTYVATFAGNEAGLTYGYSSDGDCQSNSWTTAPEAFSFQATLDYPDVCTLSAADLAFPAASMLSANVDSTSTISMRCSSGTPYTLGLSLGLGSGVTAPASRKMTSGAGADVVYGLYLDNARSQPWGPSSPDVYAATGSGQTQSVTVYGRVAPQPSPAPGNYSDTVVATVTY